MLATGDRTRARGWTALRWTLAALSMVLALRTAGLGREQLHAALRVMATLDLMPVAAVVALEVAWAVTLARTSRSAVLALGGRLGSGQALRISMAGFTLSRIVPGGGAAGGLFAVRELTRLGHSLPVATAAAVLSWATSVTSLGVVLLGGLGVAAAVGDVPATVVSATGVLLALSAAGTVVLVAIRHEAVRRRIVRLVDRAARSLPVRWRPAMLRFDVDLQHPGQVWHSAAWAAAAWMCDAAALWLVFAACGHPLAPTALLVGYASANLLNSVPELTPGWLGVFEAAQAATYITLGVPAATAVAAVLVYRLLSFWLPVAAGIVPAVRSLGTRSARATRHHAQGRQVRAPATVEPRSAEVLA